MKLEVHNHTMVIYIQYKFHEILSTCYLVLAEDGKSLKLMQSKANNSSINDDIPMKLHVHSYNIVIYFQYKFHETQSIGYLVMTEDENSLEFRHSKGNNTSVNN